jgi:large subunit ribosomal protein L10
MKTRKQRQENLEALATQFQNSKSAMVIGFQKLSVQKDQALRNELRSAGAKYQVVKNTLARIAAKGTHFEETAQHFKGVTAIAWTDTDGVDLSKAISKFLKENSEIFSFKTGLLDGKVVGKTEVDAIASLPSKEALIGKLLFVLNSPAHRLVSVINAVPQKLAVVMKQIGEQKQA